MVAGFFVFINNTNTRWKKITTLTPCNSTRNIEFDKPFLTDYFLRKYGLLRDYSHRYWSLLSVIGYVFKQFFLSTIFLKLHSFHIILIIILMFKFTSCKPLYIPCTVYYISTCGRSPYTYITIVFLAWLLQLCCQAFSVFFVNQIKDYAKVRGCLLVQAKHKCTPGTIYNSNVRV